MNGNQSNHGHVFLGQGVVHGYFLHQQNYLFYTLSHILVFTLILGIPGHSMTNSHIIGREGGPGKLIQEPFRIK